MAEASNRKWSLLNTDGSHNALSHLILIFSLLSSDQEQSPSLHDLRRVTQKPSFEDRIKATFIVDDADSSTAPKEVIEHLHEDDSDKKGSMDPQTRRRQWLRQAISVDGEKVSRKLLHQCSLDVSNHLFITWSRVSQTGGTIGEYLLLIGNKWKSSLKIGIFVTKHYHKQKMIIWRSILTLQSFCGEDIFSKLCWKGQIN